MLSCESQFALWDGIEFTSIPPPENRMEDLLMILHCKPQLRIDELSSFFVTQPLGKYHWGVFKTRPVTVLQKCGNFNFLIEAQGLRRLYYDGSKNSLECERINESLERGLGQAADHKFLISISGKLFSGYLEKHFYEQRSQLCIYDQFQIKAKPLKIKTNQFCEVRTHFALGGASIAEFHYFNERRKQFYSLQYLPFKAPLDIELKFSDNGFHYEVPKWSQGIIFLVAISTQHQPVSLKEFSTVELIRNYPYFKSRGLNFQFLNKRSHQAFQQLLKIKRKAKYEAIEGLEQQIIGESSRKSFRQATERSLVTSLSDHFLCQLGKLYVSLDQCPAHNLVFFFLIEFSSLQEMDQAVSPGRYVTALAKRLSKDGNKDLLGILQKEIFFLHAKAQELGTSLKGFYEGMVIKVEQNMIEAPSRDVGFESEKSSQRVFKNYLKRHHRKQKHLTQIFRSGLRFPPSKNEVTLQLAQQLSKTEDLAIFETKTVQIFVERRWADSRWFFLLESIFLVAGLLNIFLHASFFRTPGSLVPLMLIQVWNCTIEIVEVRTKKTAYLRDLWNWFDLLRFFFFFFYFGFAVAEPPSSLLKPAFLTLLTLFQSLKVFQLFSLFKSTRVLLKIVIQIVKDMIPFFLFVFATTLLITLLFTSATIEEKLEKKTYSKLLLHVFLLNFAQFEYTQYSPIQECVFIVAVIAAPLVLLNMLIAIMSDTFDRVKQEQGRRDYQELASLVYKYEIVSAKMCCWKKKNRNKSWKYVFYSSEARDEGDEVREHWQGRIKGIKLQLERMQLKNEEWQRRMQEKEEERRKWEEKREEQDRRNREWQKELMEQLRKQSEKQASAIERLEEVRHIKSSN